MGGAGASAAQQGVECAGCGEALQVSAGGAGAGLDLGEGAVGLSGEETFGLGGTEAGDGVQGHADSPGTVLGVGDAVVEVCGFHRAGAWCDGFHPVVLAAAVDVRAEYGDAHAAGLSHEQAGGVHPGVVLPDAGHEGFGVVGLQPCGLVGGHGESDRVGLAESEAAEGVEQLPHGVDGAVGVAAAVGGVTEGGLHGCFAVGAEQAPPDVRAAEAAAGHPVHDAHDLLVVDRHPVGLGEDLGEVRVQVLGCGPAVACVEVGADHVGLHGAGAEEGDVHDEVVELLRAHGADELALPGGLDLEAPEGVGGADQAVGVRVVAGHGVEVRGWLVGVQPCGLGDGVGQGGLHAHAQDVELDQAHGVHVVLVVLGHGQSDPAGLHGGAVQEGGVGEDYPARVHGDVAGQPVEAFGEVHEQVQLPVAAQSVRERCELGPAGELLAQGGSGDAPQLARHVVHVLGAEAEGESGVPHGPAGAVGILHAHEGDAPGAEAFEDPLVDGVAAGALDVDVDVRQIGAQRGEEPFEDEVVLEGVRRGDPEQVHHQGGDPRTAGGVAHVHLAHQLRDLPHGEEVAREPQVGDHVQLPFQPRAQ